MNFYDLFFLVDFDFVVMVLVGKLVFWIVGDLLFVLGLSLCMWLVLVGFGLLMVGVSIGVGEWLFGFVVIG